MTVKEIITEFLSAGGFDGLSYDGECACLIGDLAPCENLNTECEAGYRINAEPGSEHGFRIVSEKPEVAGKKDKASEKYKYCVVPGARGFCPRDTVKRFAGKMELEELPDEITKEAADVANIAMMIADNWGEL